MLFSGQPSNVNRSHRLTYAILYSGAVVIVAFLENATIGYSLESVCVCVCVCVFLHDNSKRNRSRNTKSEYIVVYENSSDEFGIELHQIKVKVTVGVQKFPHLPQYKLSGPIVQVWYKLGTLY